jgi:hypothetical protein
MTTSSAFVTQVNTYPVIQVISGSGLTLGPIRTLPGKGSLTGISCVPGVPETCELIGGYGAWRTRNGGDSFVREPLPTTAHQTGEIACMSVSRCIALGWR